jgi:hypothetical protein
MTSRARILQEREWARTRHTLQLLFISAFDPLRLRIKRFLPVKECDSGIPYVSPQHQKSCRYLHGLLECK